MTANSSTDQKDLKLLLSRIDMFSSNAFEVLFSLLQVYMGIKYAFMYCISFCLFVFLQKVYNILLPSWGQKQPISVASAHIFVTLLSNSLAILKVLMNELLENGTYKVWLYNTNCRAYITVVLCSIEIQGSSTWCYPYTW